MRNVGKFDNSRRKQQQKILITPSIYQATYQSIHPQIFLSVHNFRHPSNHQLIHPDLHLTIHPSIYSSIHPIKCLYSFIHPFIFFASSSIPPSSKQIYVAVYSSISSIHIFHTFISASIHPSIHLSINLPSTSVLKFLLTIYPYLAEVVVLLKWNVSHLLALLHPIGLHSQEHLLLGAQLLHQVVCDVVQDGVPGGEGLLGRLLLEKAEEKKIISSFLSKCTDFTRVSPSFSRYEKQENFTECWKKTEKHRISLKTWFWCWKCRNAGIKLVSKA